MNEYYCQTCDMPIDYDDLAEHIADNDLNDCIISCTLNSD